MTTTRTERDAMGTMEVPESALYGAGTQRAVENFPVSGIPLPPLFIRVFAAIKRESALVNAELQQLDPEVAQAIAGVALEIENGKYADQFPVDIFQTGSGTSTNMNVNEVIARLASRKLERPVHPNDDVNKGQSSNDVFPTAIHVAVLLALKQQLFPVLHALEASLLEKERAFATILKIGRTHLQDATPMTLGQEFSGYRQQIINSIERLEMACIHLHELPIGGTAIGTGINAHPTFGKRVSERLAKYYGLPLTETRNHFEAQAAKDACVQCSGTLRTVAVGLAKIANDLRFLACGPRAGLAEITLPAVQPGSSIMPGKVNPVLCESLLQVCAQVIGNDAAIVQAANLSNFELNVGMPLIAHNLLQSITLLTNVVRLFEEKCVRGIEANSKRIEKSIEANLMLATALAPKLGYDRAASIAKRAHDEGKTIREVARDEGMEEKELAELLDPKKML